MGETKGGLASLRRLDALHLKLIAMALMLCDHIWFTFLQDKGIGFEWMTWIGRIAFPIFAFQIVEGFVHTHNFKRYWGRMLLFALISEIPFNMMVGPKPFYPEYQSVMMPGRMPFYPEYQNVMFTFAIALPLLALIRKAREKGGTVYPLTVVGCAVLGYFAGYLAQTDYYGDGVLMVLLLYLVRDTRCSKLGQFASLALINLGTFGIMSLCWIRLGPSTSIMAGAQQGAWISHGAWQFFLPHVGPGFEWKVTEQAFALLALPLIWMYNGTQGKHSRALKYAGYAFYPVHLLILGLLAKVI